MNVEKKLATFSKIIEEEANFKRQNTLEEIDKKLNSSMAEFKRQAQAEATTKIDGEKTATERLVKREISMYANDKKRALLSKRTELEDKLFSAIEKKLIQYTNTSEYKENLIKNIEAEIKNQPCEIIVTKSDYEKIFSDNSLDNIKPAVDDFFIGGYRVILKNKGIINDNTYKLKLSDHRDNFKGLKTYT